MWIIWLQYTHLHLTSKYPSKKNYLQHMFDLEITTLDGVQNVQLPSGWHEVSYTYYKERIAPYANPEDDVVKNNVHLVCSMLDVKATQANIMEFSSILGNLLEWMEQVPEVSEFTHNGQTYTLPILGKAQAGDKPFMTVGDWENANDAMRFLNESEYDDNDASDVGLILLAALAQGDQELNDIEFARRLDEWKDVSMDAMLYASFFFLQFKDTFKITIPRSLTKQTKRLEKINKNISLDGLRWFLKLQPLVYLESLKKMAQ